MMCYNITVGSEMKGKETKTAERVQSATGLASVQQLS
jgi:hypothetical protein